MEEELRQEQKDTYFKCDNFHYLQTLTEGTFEDETVELKKNSGNSNTFSRVKDPEIIDSTQNRNSHQTAKFATS